MKVESNKLLFIGNSRASAQEVLGEQSAAYDIEFEADPLRALVRLSRGEFEGVYIDGRRLDGVFELGRLTATNQILEGMPDAVVLLNEDKTILWGNTRLKEWCQVEDFIGANFYSVLGSPEILGPDFCPFHTALATNTATTSTLRSDEGRFYQVHATPVKKKNRAPNCLIVTVRDVTEATHQQHKLSAIHQAGMRLADLAPDELLQMTVDERVELLKSDILQCTQDLLNYQVVEIRLLVEESGELRPLLAVGMVPDAANRKLYAQPAGNGVTGFVAATGKSYLCEDTTDDPLYLSGTEGAKSSLTVPLILHDKVIGTFNVESPEPRAFEESDLQFLEIFTRDVAVALNTLELLVAEKASTAAASVEAIHSAVALPVDEILCDTVHVIERYIGHEPEVVERLQRTLRNARDIKQVIQKVGQRMAPSQALPVSPEADSQLLRGTRVLVADEDDEVRSAAHDLLDRYGCTVETAPNGALALFMVRYSGYNAVIADIRLPDMSGYQFMLKLQEVLEVDPVPLILMTGFGYDPGHSIVKARQAGLQHILYKPFRLDQLLNSVQQVVARPTVG